MTPTRLTSSNTQQDPENSPDMGTTNLQNWGGTLPWENVLVASILDLGRRESPSRY